LNIRPEDRSIKNHAKSVFFFTAEMTNHYVLDLWDFSAGAMGQMNPWLRAVVLSIAMGLAPVIVNSVTHRRRLRIG
jgi:hypothetical protein